MIVAIHQPHYLPWLRYFDKIARADAFVLLDDAQFTKNDWQNRTRVKGPAGPVTLTVPVRSRLGETIAKTEIAVENPWRRKHAKTLMQYYGACPAFKEAGGPFTELLSREWAGLGELAEATVRLACRSLGIGTRIVRASEVGGEGTGTGRLVAICRELGADAYLAGAYSVEQYLDVEAFRREGVSLLVQDWKPPAYPQRYEQAGFAPDLSVVDLLFNCGADSLKILLRGGDGYTAL